MKELTRLRSLVEADDDEDDAALEKRVSKTRTQQKKQREIPKNLRRAVDAFNSSKNTEGYEATLVMTRGKYGVQFIKMARFTAFLERDEDEGDEGEELFSLVVPGTFHSYIGDDLSITGDMVETFRSLISEIEENVDNNDGELDIDKRNYSPVL